MTRWFGSRSGMTMRAFQKTKQSHNLASENILGGGIIRSDACSLSLTDTLPHEIFFYSLLCSSEISGTSISNSGTVQGRWTVKGLVGKWLSFHSSNQSLLRLHIIKKEKKKRNVSNLPVMSSLAQSCMDVCILNEVLTACVFGQWFPHAIMLKRPSMLGSEGIFTACSQHKYTMRGQFGR